MDYLRGAQALYNLARVKVAPRYPRATELVYLRNAGNGSAESEDTLELCIDPIHTSERVEHLAIDYSTKKARLHRVGSFEQFPGVVRPIWPLPDGRNLILSKDRDIVL